MAFFSPASRSADRLTVLHDVMQMRKFPGSWSSRRANRAWRTEGKCHTFDSFICYLVNHIQATKKIFFFTWITFQRTLQCPKSNEQHIKKKTLHRKKKMRKWWHAGDIWPVRCCPCPANPVHRDLLPSPPSKHSEEGSHYLLWDLGHL